MKTRLPPLSLSAWLIAIFFAIDSMLKKKLHIHKTERIFKLKQQKKEKYFQWFEPFMGMIFFFWIYTYRYTAIHYHHWNSGRRKKDSFAPFLPQCEMQTPDIWLNNNKWMKSRWWTSSHMNIFFLDCCIAKKIVPRYCIDWQHWR